ACPTNIRPGLSCASARDEPMCRRVGVSHCPLAVVLWPHELPHVALAFWPESRSPREDFNRKAVAGGDVVPIDCQTRPILSRPMHLRTLAIDWSGAASGAESKIWLAEAAAGELVRLECGRSRRGIAEFLINEAVSKPNLVV